MVDRNNAHEVHEKARRVLFRLSNMEILWDENKYVLHGDIYEVFRKVDIDFLDELVSALDEHPTCPLYCRQVDGEWRIALESQKIDRFLADNDPDDINLLKTC